MTTDKKLGIWMDNSSAHLMEFATEIMQSNTITSKSTHEEKAFSIARGEKLMHNKEQHQQADYYKQIIEQIRNYKEVLLFGPTNAKAELFNIIKADHRFADIKIEVLDTDNMTDNQQNAFVKKHFSTH